jgi:predicted transcriptional regulator
MSRTIELPDELYENLERVARGQGVTPAGWIAKAVPAFSTASNTRSVADELEGLLGAVNSLKESATGRRRSPFSDLLVQKFEKQGLRGA